MMTTGLSLLAVFPLISFLDAGQETLAERVRRQQGPIEVLILKQYPPADLPEIMKESDLIARVLVLDNGRSRLSKDERSIYSEFTVQVLDQFFSARNLKLTEKLVVTKPGGTMMIEGYPITGREPDFPPFEANEEYVLFLKFDPSTGQYLVPYGAQGAFRNIGGVVEQVAKGSPIWDRDRGRVPIGEFTQELTRILAAR